jgi:hypothetical protein
MLLFNPQAEKLKLDIGVSEEKLKSQDYYWPTLRKNFKMYSIPLLKNGSKKINFI